MDIRTRGVCPAGRAMDVSVHFKRYYKSSSSIFEVSTVMIVCNIILLLCHGHLRYLCRLVYKILVKGISEWWYSGGRVKPKFCELSITVPFYVYPVSFYTLYLTQYKLFLSYFVGSIGVYMSINSF